MTRVGTCQLKRLTQQRIESFVRPAAKKVKTRVSERGGECEREIYIERERERKREREIYREIERKRETVCLIE